jgi:hypothetical protein
MSTTMEGLPVAQETEVTAKAARRRFTATEKLRVVREADACSKTGELGALLRREGLVRLGCLLVGEREQDSASAGGRGRAHAAQCDQLCHALEPARQAQY